MIKASHDGHHPPLDEGNHRDPVGDKAADERARREMEAADQARERAIKEREREYRAIIEKQRRDGRDHVTAWLLLRIADGDVGIRPLAPGAVFWESPDIWVETPSASPNPVANAKNFVHARIYNLGGLTASPVRVDYFWANPSLAISSANVHHIGTEHAIIPSLTSKEIRCTSAWVPEIVNGGHECLIVQCTSWVTDPLINPLQPVLDRHVGQRNVQVVAGAQQMSLNLQINSILPFTSRTRVRASTTQLRLNAKALHAEPAPDKIAAAALAFLSGQTSLYAGSADARAGKVVRRNVAKARVVERRRAEQPPLFELVDSEPALRLSARAGERRGYVSGKPDVAGLDIFRAQAGGMILGPRTHVLHECELDAMSFQHVEIALAPTAGRRGDVLVTHLYQESEDVVLGGYTVVHII